MKMNPRTFFYTSLFTGIGLFILFALINLQLDIYGIHQPNKLKDKKVYFNEEYSKYLLSKKYVPLNFNGIFIGPSLSDNIDTQELDFVNFYNLSFMGARMSDLDFLIRTVVSNKNSNIKTVILCINPYLTEISSNLISDLSTYAYKESFGSYNLIKTYLIAIIRYFDFMPNKYPKNQFSNYGFNNYNKLFSVDSLKTHILKKAKEDKNKEIEYNEESLLKLKKIKSYLKRNNIPLVIYFHPIPRDIYLTNIDQYLNYKETILNCLDNDINYIDFNISEFIYFTSDYSNYIDHGHLSDKGQLEITRLLNKYYESNEINIY